MGLRSGLISLLMLGAMMGSSSCYALVDPTMPSEERTSSGSSSMLLSAIMIWPNKRLAVIDGKIIHEGEIINNAKVIKISSNDVELQGVDGRFSLELLTYPLKRVK